MGFKTCSRNFFKERDVSPHGRWDDTMVVFDSPFFFITSMIFTKLLYIKTLSKITDLN